MADNQSPAEQKDPSTKRDNEKPKPTSGQVRAEHPEDEPANTGTPKGGEGGSVQQ